MKNICRFIEEHIEHVLMIWAAVLFAAASALMIAMIFIVSA